MMPSRSEDSEEIEGVLLKAAMNAATENDWSWPSLVMFLVSIKFDVYKLTKDEWMKPFDRYRQLTDYVRAQGCCPQPSPPVSEHDSGFYEKNDQRHDEKHNQKSYGRPNQTEIDVQVETTPEHPEGRVSALILYSDSTEENYISETFCNFAGLGDGVDRKLELPCYLEDTAPAVVVICSVKPESECAADLVLSTKAIKASVDAREAEMVPDLPTNDQYRPSSNPSREDIDGMLGPFDDPQSDFVLAATIGHFFQDPRSHDLSRKKISTVSENMAFALQHVKEVKDERKRSLKPPTKSKER